VRKRSHRGGGQKKSGTNIFHGKMRISPGQIVRQSTFLTLLAVLVTISLWNTEPLLVWGYEIAVFLLAGWLCWRDFPKLPGLPFVSFPIAAAGVWGFFQLVFGSTVYRWATLNAALQNLALAATALAAYLAFRKPHSQAPFLSSVRWFSLTLAIISVLSYWTSPGRILWIFPAAYPDNWGPFPSRNNFAQFLELSFPVALREMGLGNGHLADAIPPAVLLGAGLASGSRAGSILLVAECVMALYLIRRRWRAQREGRLQGKTRRLRRPIFAFALASIALASLAGGDVLIHRFSDPNPFQFRREIFHATWTMIHARPWSGYGLGTFSTVYPQFAEFDPGASVEHAHSDWLEWTAEGGALYAALWAAVAVWSVRPALRSVWGLGVPAVFLHALVDYPFARLGISVWVVLLLSALARDSEKCPGWEPLFERSNQ
jgi:O-antigen ligase